MSRCHKVGKLETVWGIGEREKGNGVMEEEEVKGEREGGRGRERRYREGAI